eukprot:403341355
MQKLQLKQKAREEDSLAMSDDEYLNDQMESISWIEWHCSLEGHQFLAQVDTQFIRDNFNQSGLKKIFENYEDALQMILGESPEQADLDKESFSKIYQQAFDLYGLIHSRFIQTPKGFQIIRQKYQDGVFGKCPRVQCGMQAVLPIGMSDELSISKVKIYCPKCEDVFVPKGQRSSHSTNSKGCQIFLDGAYFGTSFPSVYLMNYQRDVPDYGPQTFIPTIYGFKVNGMPGSSKVCYQKDSFKVKSKSFTLDSSVQIYTFQDPKRQISEQRREKLNKDLTHRKQNQLRVSQVSVKGHLALIIKLRFQKFKNRKIQLAQMYQQIIMQVDPVRDQNQMRQRGQQVFQVMEEERQRRLLEQTQNKMGSQLRKMMIQKAHQFFCQEIQHHAKVDEINNNSRNLRLSVSNSNGIEGTSDHQILTPSKMKNNSHLNQQISQEDKIQRYEDLQRLEFFKQYKDHKLLTKQARKQESFKYEESAIQASIHGFTFDEFEQERCPPVDIMIKYEDSPVMKQERQFVFPQEDYYKQKGIELETAQQEDKKPVKSSKQSKHQQNLNKLATPKHQLASKQNLNSKQSTVRQQYQQPNYSSSSEIINIKNAKSQKKPQNNNFTSPQRSSRQDRVLSPVGQKQKLNEQVENQVRENEIKQIQNKGKILVTSYKQKGILSCKISPNQDDSNQSNYRESQNQRNGDQQNSDKQILITKESETLHTEESKIKSTQLSLRKIDSQQDNLDPYFYGSQEGKHEISKLKVSQRDVDSDESQNMQELVQELTSLTSGVQLEKVKSQESIQKQEIIDQVKTQLSPEILHSQEYQSLVEKTCEALLMKFQDIVEKHQDIRLRIQDQGINNQIFSQQKSKQPSIDIKDVEDQVEFNQTHNSSQRQVVEDQTFQTKEEYYKISKSEKNLRDLSNGKSSSHSQQRQRSQSQRTSRVASPIESPKKEYEQTSQNYEQKYHTERNTIQPPSSSSIFNSINKNAEILRRIKNEASPKIPSHKDISSSSANFQTKTQHIYSLQQDATNIDLKRYLSENPDERIQYQQLIENYDLSLKQINVKLLQSFRGKRNADQNETKIGLSLMMLLSGIDKNIMLTNDKSNIVQKTWSHFQEYFSSVGQAYNNLQKIKTCFENLVYHQNFVKNLNLVINQINHSSVDKNLMNYLTSAQQYISFIYELFEIGQIKRPEENLNRNNASKSVVRRENSVSAQLRTVSPIRKLRTEDHENSDQMSSDQERSIPLRSQRLRQSQNPPITDQKQLQHQQRLQNKSPIKFTKHANASDSVRQSAHLNQDSEQKQVMRANYQSQRMQSNVKQNTTPLKQMPKSPSQNSQNFNHFASPHVQIQQVNSENDKNGAQLSEIQKERLRLIEMEMKVQELQRERDMLRRQIDQDDKKILKEQEKQLYKSQDSQQTQKQSQSNSYDSKSSKHHSRQQNDSHSKNNQSQHQQQQIRDQFVESNQISRQVRDMDVEGQSSIKSQIHNEVQQEQNLKTQYKVNQEQSSRISDSNHSKDQMQNSQQNVISFESDKAQHKQMKNTSSRKELSQEQSNEQSLISEIDKQILEFQQMKQALLQQQNQSKPKPQIKANSSEQKQTHEPEQTPKNFNFTNQQQEQQNHTSQGPKKVSHIHQLSKVSNLSQQSAHAQSIDSYNKSSSRMMEVSGRLKTLQQQEEELKQQLALFNNMKANKTQMTYQQVNQMQNQFGSSIRQPTKRSQNQL